MYTLSNDCNSELIVSDGLGLIMVEGVLKKILIHLLVCIGEVSL